MTRYIKTACVEYNLGGQQYRGWFAIGDLDWFDTDKVKDYFIQAGCTEVKIIQMGGRKLDNGVIDNTPHPLGEIIQMIF